MKIFRAYKTELDLNPIQRLQCCQHAGAARFAYNWTLRRKMEVYTLTGKTISAYELSRELTQLKKTEFAWMYTVSNECIHEAVLNVNRAYDNFFRQVKMKREGKQVKVGFPKFKSKWKSPKKFCLRQNIRVEAGRIRLPRLGWLRLKEKDYLPTTGVKILRATISERAGRWFVSLQVEVEIPDPLPNDQPAVGIDLGISALATMSNGETIPNPRALKHALQKIKCLQRTLARRQYRGANWRKAEKKLARAHYHVANLRKDLLHKGTSQIVKTKSAVVLEDLNVRGMLKNHRLALAISDVGFFEFRRQITYKGKWYGCRVVFAPRFFPSTKRCSNCGTTKAHVALSERVYVCEKCGLVIDRDLNAARNLEKLL